MDNWMKALDGSEFGSDESMQELYNNNEMDTHANIQIRAWKQKPPLNCHTYYINKMKEMYPDKVDQKPDVKVMTEQDLDTEATKVMNDDIINDKIVKQNLLEVKKMIINDQKETAKKDQRMTAYIADIENNCYKPAKSKLETQI